MISVAANQAAPLVAPPVVDKNDVAEMLKASPSTIDRLNRAGRMPASFKIGNLVRWSRAEIESWIAAGCPKREA